MSPTCSVGVRYQRLIGQRPNMAESFAADQRVSRPTGQASSAVAGVVAKTRPWARATGPVSAGPVRPGESRVPQLPGGT